MEEYKTTINVLGCCVSRDSIDYKKEKYVVPRYAAFVSPWSMFSGNKVDVSNETLLTYGISQFQAKCIQHDAQLSTIAFLKECNSDWLLFDLADSRLNIVAWKNKNVFLSFTTGLKKTIKAFEEKLGTQHENINYLNLSWDEFEKKLNFLLENILELYKPERIIFNEIYCANALIDKNKCLRQWEYQYAWFNDYIKKANPFLDKVYQYSLNKLKGCHIIKWIDNVLSIEEHRWGTSPLHYHEFYYDYAEKAISIITKNLDSNIEKKELENLHRLYTQKFATLRAEMSCNTVRFDRDKWHIYSDTFKKLLENFISTTNNDISLCIYKLLFDKGYKHISFYGYTEITKVLIKLLDSTDISIDYIVENNVNPTHKINIISRDSLNYPTCDLMLIADVSLYNTIKAKLEKMKVPFPFYNAAEFIQSLPTGENDCIDRIKKYIADLSEQLSASVKNEARLTKQLNDLTKQDIASRKTIDKLNNDIKLMSDDKNKILAEKQKVASERDVALSERNAANSEIQAIRNSISFKVGRGLTLIPRKIRDFIKAKKK